jgi:hypothetical protein
MKIKCICCGKDVNLDRRVFEDYEGPVRCFSCSTHSISPVPLLEQGVAATGESIC